jgi:hypothetical protein
MIGERRATVRRETLLPLLLREPASNVGHLVVTAGSWSDDDDDAFQVLIKSLRTSTYFRDLFLYRLGAMPFPDLELVEELVATYNHHLLSVTLVEPGAAAFQARINPTLERNRRVRALFRRPPDDNGC